MNVDVFCPTCSTLFTVRRDVLGKKTKCTNCGTVFVIAEPVAATVPASTIPPSPPISEPFPEIDMSAPAPIARTTTRATAARPAHPGEVFGFEHDNIQPQFPALRLVARGYEIMALLALTFAAILFVMLIIAVLNDPSNFIGAILASGMTFFWAIFMALTLLFVAQLIRLALQVEQNTRESRDACRQLAEHLCGIEREP